MKNRIHLFLLLLVLLCTLIGCSPAKPTGPGDHADRRIFDMPEDAVAELKAALNAGDVERLVNLVGENRRELIVTGDPVADQLFIKDLAIRFNQRAELLPVIIGAIPGEQWYKVRYSNEGWRLHTPLVNSGSGWFFATDYASRTALKVRRKFNEVTTVDTLRSLLAAQFMYRNRDYDGDGVKAYAQKFLSSPGKRDGLYWPPEDSGPISPLDGFIARAMEQGYQRGTPSYEGYVYKILTGQGRRARGGARSYLIDGKLKAGFAILAYPLKWRVSGDRTFVVSDQKRVLMKDLGSRTKSMCENMTEMDIDSTWVLADWNLGGENSRITW